MIGLLLSLLSFGGGLGFSVIIGIAGVLSLRRSMSRLQQRQEGDVVEDRKDDVKAMEVIEL